MNKFQPHPMNKIIVSVLALVISFSLGSCKKKSNPSASTASVSFINGCAGTSGIDVKVNNLIVSGAANVSFLGNTGYKPVTAGSVTIACYLTNAGALASTNTVALTAGNYYSAFSSGLLTAPSFLLVPDDHTSPSSGNAKVRIVNLSPDTLSLTATVGSTNFATSITSLSASAYYPVIAGTYELKAGDPSDISTIVSTGPQQLGAGKIYTIIYTGSKYSLAQSALKATLLSNN
jgi:hypothetical protein